MNKDCECRIEQDFNGEYDCVKDGCGCYNSGYLDGSEQAENEY